VSNPHDFRRLFLALTLPPPVRDALAALAEPIPGVAWTRPEQLHLTLRFLGDVSRQQEEAMIERLEAVRVGAFILPVEGAGAFPSEREPRVLWAGVGNGHPRLFQLRQRVDDGLIAAGLTLDLRTFHPHTTLARCTAPATPAIGRWLRAHRELAAPPFRVESFDLYASELRPSGAVHTLVRRFALVES
jgi:2'-5' RNA ligase